MQPISEQVFNLLGESKEPNGIAFVGLKYSGYVNRPLFQWIRATAMSEQIAFNCFKHAFASIQISMGTGIGTNNRY